MGRWKPNTTMNISVELLEQIDTFLSDNPTSFLNSLKRNSRNVLIEKALIYYINHWEEIKKAA